MPPLIEYFTTFRVDWTALTAIAFLGSGYLVGVLATRRHGVPWPARRIAGFYILGLGSYAIVSFGFPGVYTYELRWAEITRWALLLFVVPWFLATGKPVALADAALIGRAHDRFHLFLDGRFLRVVGNAVFEPLLTVAIFMVFVTSFAAWLRLSPLPQNIATVFIPLFGLLTVIPIAESTRVHRSLSLTFEFMIAMGALIFDALPGILLRLHYTVLDGVTKMATGVPSWWPNPLHDQHLAGDMIWFIAEIADIPVIVILFVRWSRTDDKEAAAIDELSDEEMEALTREHLRRSQR